jgi:hypothetical protein
MNTSSKKIEIISIYFRGMVLFDSDLPIIKYSSEKLYVSYIFSMIGGRGGVQAAEPLPVHPPFPFLLKYYCIFLA